MMPPIAIPRHPKENFIMQVLLLKDVPGLGKAGEVKEATGGYALNYLLPRKLATQATEGALQQSQNLKEVAEQKRERKHNEAKDLAARIEGRTVTFKGRTGEGDRLYGSITNADIAAALSKAIGTEVERRLVEVERPIKSLGEHKAIVKIAAGLSATIYVRVERAAVEG
jgi:large subunit ribosomal protein L9